MAELTTNDNLYDIFNSKNHFKNEKHMSDYIEDNIRLFCKEILEDEYITHSREYVFESGWRKRNGNSVKKGEHNTRLDFLIICKNDNYAVEVKNPKQIRSSLVNAISQIMNYQYEIEKRSIRASLVLVSSKHSVRFVELVRHFGLKFRYILFNKDYSAEYEWIND